MDAAIAAIIDICRLVTGWLRRKKRDDDDDNDPTSTIGIRN